MHPGSWPWCSIAAARLCYLNSPSALLALLAALRCSAKASLEVSGRQCDLSPVDWCVSERERERKWEGEREREREREKVGHAVNGISGMKQQCGPLPVHGFEGAIHCSAAFILNLQRRFVSTATTKNPPHDMVLMSCNHTNTNMLSCDESCSQCASNRSFENQSISSYWLWLV